MAESKLLRLYMRWGRNTNYAYTTSYFTFLCTMSSDEQQYYTTRHYLANNENIYADVISKLLSDFPLNAIANVSHNIACASSPLVTDPVLTRLVNLMGEISIPWTYAFDDYTLDNASIYFQVATDADFTTVIQQGYYTASGGDGTRPLNLTQGGGGGRRSDIRIPIYIYNETNDTIKSSYIQAYTFNDNATVRQAFQESVGLNTNDNNLRPLIALPPYEPDTDPYSPGGSSGTGGGQGTFDGTGEDIDIPGLPTLSAVDTGFITLFNPNLAQLHSLANYMWSDLFSLETFKKMFADPMQAILGLSIVPVAVPNGGTRTVTVGNISTGVSMTVASTQYVEVDCGTLNVEEYWGAYLDYDPYTKCHIYLPYIGTHPISTDDIMGKAVRVVYHVDILSGACTAFVKCGGSVMYEFIGQVASSIPVTGDNFTNVINGVLNIAGSIGTMVATGGFSPPISVFRYGSPTAYRRGHFMSAGASVAQDVMSMKPQVEKSGGMSGTGGMLAVQVPYLILERPRQAIPSGQNQYMGYPSYITDRLGELSGYTEVEYIHLENIPCTELEAEEIIQYLENGVIL